MLTQSWSRVAVLAAVIVGSFAGCSAVNQPAGAEEGSDPHTSCLQVISPILEELQVTGLTETFVNEGEVYCAGAEVEILGRSTEAISFTVPKNFFLVTNKISQAELTASESVITINAFLVSISQPLDPFIAPLEDYAYVKFGVYKDSVCDLDKNIEFVGGNNGQIALQRIDSIFGASDEVLLNYETLSLVITEPKIKYADSLVYSISSWCPLGAPTMKLTLISSSKTADAKLRSLLEVVQNESGTSELLKSRLQCKNWARHEGLKKFSEAPNGEASCFNWCVAQDWSHNKWWRQQFRDRQGQGETLGFQMYEGGFTQFVDEFCGELAMGTE